MMALTRHTSHYQIRPMNKEPEWSRICDNVLDQYYDEDDPFGLVPNQVERGSSSGDSATIFNPSGSSEQSDQIAGTSPIPSLDNLPLGAYTMQAQQPQAKEGIGFWQKTLRILEHNALQTENRQLKLRSAKSHPDFLSLGGLPSPPIPAVPPPAQQTLRSRKIRDSTKRNKTPPPASRSLSRGRPTGVSKTPIQQHGNARKSSASPHKMMNPSRYRAGFKNVWADKLEASPRRYGLRITDQHSSVSPLRAPRYLQAEDFAPFGSPKGLPADSLFDPEMSPLARTFQQSHIYSPLASSVPGPYVPADSLYLEYPPIPQPGFYAQQIVSLHDTDGVHPDRSSSLTSNRIASFDFGFSTSPGDVIDAAELTDDTPAYYAPLQYADDPFVMAEYAGHGIGHDPSRFPAYGTAEEVTPIATTHVRGTSDSESHASQRFNGGLPLMASRVRTTDLRHRTPSPLMADSRSRSRSQSRRASRHRRTKSGPVKLRASQNVAMDAFVNYTPQDGTEILGGVAPSGSSKTKARRDKEAAEKRRRLSQAAIRAVVDAGGDLDGLAKTGLLLQ